MPFRASALVVASCAILSFACASAPIDEGTARHVVMIHRDGSLASPRAVTARPLPMVLDLPVLAEGLPKMEASDAGSPFETQITALKEFARRTGNKRLLIFIHGGLNTPTQTVHRAADLGPKIEEAGYFPIFINWESQLMSSYFEHLFRVRQGQRWNTWISYPTSPIVLGSDLMRAVARSPLVWISMFGNYFEELGEAFTESSSWRTSEERVLADKTPALDKGADERDPRREKGRSGVLRVAFIPTQLASGPVVDAFGKSAWDMMLRRTELMFRRETVEGPKPGALAEFLGELSEVVTPDWEVVLVAHSMGTIIANRMLQDFGEIGFDEIVYMAAASSVDAYESAAFEYLADQRSARFHHLTLNHNAEVREAPVWGLVIQGSLLVWIDDFLSTPVTPRGRTAGRYVNLIVAAPNTPVEDDIRGRISIKEFDAGARLARESPQKHGSFSSCAFWDPRFWEIGGSYELCEE